LKRGISLAAIRTIGTGGSAADRLQLVEHRILASWSVLVVDQEPIEPAVAGNFYCDGRAQMRNVPATIRGEHALTKFAGDF